MIQLSDIIEYIKEYVINVSHDVEDLVVKNISTLDSSLPECMGWIATYKKEKQKLAEQSNVKYLITDTEVLITPKLLQSHHPCQQSASCFHSHCREIFPSQLL